MDRPIKVLAVVFKLNRAGLESRLMDIIRNLDIKRVQIDIYTYQLEPGVYDEEVKALGGIVYYNPPLTVKNMFWYVQYFKDFLKKHPEYKIVHAHQDAWCSVFCKGAYLAGVPIRIAHSRTAISVRSFGYIAKDIIKLPTRRYANYYFAVSKKAAIWLYGRKLYEQGKVQIWPNAIDAERFYYDETTRDKVRKENKWNEKYVIMHVGNFTAPKNHPFILEVFNEVRKKTDNALLILVGTGDRSFIDEYIGKHDLEQCIQLLGTRGDVNELLQGADVFFFPSVFEGLPGALVEAQAAGLPCVISNTIAEEVQITPNLTILSLGTPKEEWSESIIRYKNFVREDTRKNIEEKGFDVQSLTDKLCQFYENAYEQGEKQK